MGLPVATTKNECPRLDIAAYIDGELKPSEELALEAHIAHCSDCLAELNLQKQMLQVLDFGLESENELPLPENFAKVVATRAESGVSGLRSKEERSRAFLLSSLLLLVIVVGLGAETEKTLTTSGEFIQHIFAVVSFLGHLIFDLAFGITIILRSLSSQFVYSPLVSFIIIGFLFALSALALSRIISRYNRS